MHLDDIDLAGDGRARWIIKDEIVSVEFAASEGELASAVGINRYAPGDAVLTGSTGDRWCVSRGRFDAKYRPLGSARPGEPGHYRNVPAPIRGRQMTESFSVARSAGGDVLQGSAGDWLVEYAPGDHGIVARARFDVVYRVV